MPARESKTEICWKDLFGITCIGFFAYTPRATTALIEDALGLREQVSRPPLRAV